MNPRLCCAAQLRDRGPGQVSWEVCKGSWCSLEQGRALIQGCPKPWLTPGTGLLSGMGLRSRPAAGSHEKVSFLEDGDAGRRLRQGLAAKGKGPTVYRRVLRSKAAVTGLCPRGWGQESGSSAEGTCVCTVGAVLRVTLHLQC